MPRRKRNHDETVIESNPMDNPNSTVLDHLRNMSEFASLIQYISHFGKIIKVQDIGISDFEDECIKPTHSDFLSNLGLSILKFVSSHRGLTLEIFEEYSRRQYYAKAPELNPFGDEEIAKKFSEFDVYTKIRILHQMTLFTLFNPDKIREKFPDETLYDQLDWRLDPAGWDGQERTYYVFNDLRLYRQTDPTIEEPVKKKAKKKIISKGSRSSRRRSTRVISESPETEEQEGISENALAYEPNFEGRKWECIAITLGEYNAFLETLQTSRDPDEKNLRKYLTDEVVPLLQNEEEKRLRVEMRKVKEIQNLEKLATAKRSGRLAAKFEARKEQDVLEEAERKRQADLEMAHREQKRQLKLEEEHKSRMMTREQRLRDREVKRILHEEELAKEQQQLSLSQNGSAEINGSRVSHRQLKADVEKRKKELEDLQVDEEWVFDCSVCGVYGKNIDDGSHSIACESCGVWQHSNCHGIDMATAEREDFVFICNFCQEKKRRAEAEAAAKLKAEAEAKLKAGAEAEAEAKAKALEDAAKSNLSPSVSQTATAVPYIVNPVSSITSRNSTGSKAEKISPPDATSIPYTGPSKVSNMVHPPSFKLPVSNGHLSKTYSIQQSFVEQQQQHCQQQQQQQQKSSQNTSFTKLAPVNLPPTSVTLPPVSSITSSPPPAAQHIHNNGQGGLSNAGLQNYVHNSGVPHSSILSTPKQTHGNDFNKSFNALGYGSPPTPHLPSPQLNGGGSTTITHSHFPGSSPGYSPVKPPSPPRPVAHEKRVIPSIILPPEAKPAAKSSPIKPEWNSISNNNHST